MVDAAGNELYPPPAILHRQSTAEDEELAIDWRADEEEYRTPYEDEDLSDWDRDDEDYDDADEEEEQLISEELADFGDEIARTHEEGWFDADDDPD